VVKMNGVLFVAAVTLALACGASTRTEDAPEAEESPREVAPLPALLERPFTAEQIRDEWVQGFRLKVRRWTPEVEIFEEWRVLEADADGVAIASVTMDAAGAVMEEAPAQRSTWVQLRDHASFPADRATREAATRETPFGELGGWLYTINDAASGVVTEFFFAEAFPGAPVFVHVIREGEIVEIFEQVERQGLSDVD
jgi:hypothetical protein